MNVYRSAGSRLGPVSAILLPVLAIVLSLVAWATAVSRSGFWADDFLNITHFYHSLGDLADTHINAGRYVTNVFFAIGTYAFGVGSVVPYLVLDALIFGAGVAIWLRAGSTARWRALDAVWVAGLFIATSVWYETALFASAITHACGFLALGLGLLSHERCMRAPDLRRTWLWSLASGAAWTLAEMSNILYLGLLPIAVYCAAHQAIRLTALGVPRARAIVAAASWNVALPITYFALVAYPATNSKPEYAHSSLRYVHANLRFYRAQLAPSTLLVVIYIAIIGGAIGGAIFAIRRRDWFPAAVVAAAGATAMASLVQSQERAIFYLAMPMLLTFSALAAGLRPLLLARRKNLRLGPALALAASVSLVVIFGQGANVRSYFVETPFGSTLASFRSNIARMTPAGAAICARLNLSPEQRTFFTAAMTGPDGFYVPPISASAAYLLSPAEHCPVLGAVLVAVTEDGRGDFVAAR